MALKHKLDTLDGLEEALKPLYAKGDGGRFTLQVEDAPATNTIAKLKLDLETATKALKDRETAETNAHAEAERSKLEAKGDYEKLKLNLDAEKLTLQRQVDESQSGLKSYLLKAEITAAIAATKGNPHLLKLVQDQFEAVISPDGVHKVLVKGDPTKTVTQYIEALRKDPSYGAFFEGTGASGSGAPPSGGPPSNAAAAVFDPKNASYSYTEQMKVARDNPALFTSLRAQFPDTKPE